MVKKDKNVFLWAVGLVMVASSTIGPNGVEVPIVPETKKVVRVYSGREMEQIESFRNDTELAMWARGGGMDLRLRNIVDRMLDNYSKMSPEIRDAVKGEMEEGLMYFRNVNGGFPGFYKTRVRSLGLDID